MRTFARSAGTGGATAGPGVGWGGAGCRPHEIRTRERIVGDRSGGGAERAAAVAAGKHCVTS